MNNLTMPLGETRKRVELWFEEYSGKSISLGREDVRARLHEYAAAGRDISVLPTPWRIEDEFAFSLELKRAHTKRVVTLAEDIASSLRLSGDDATIAFVVGYLHDVGRFPQLRKHGSFNDTLTENHSMMCIDALHEEGVDKWFAPPDFEIIKASILNHNVRKLPAIDDERVLTHAKIIRDADKLDILYFITQNRGKDFFFMEQAQEPHDFSEELIAKVLAHESLSYSLLKSRCDRVLFDIGLIYDVNFAWSFDIIKQNSYTEKLLSFYIGQHPAISDIIKSTNTYIDERCTKT